MRKVFLCVWAAVLLFAAGRTQAATVTFFNIVDGDLDPATGFDASATTATGNTLDIALGDFTANGSTGPNSVLDTLAFLVTAPEGWLITKVRYEEGGTVLVEDGIAVATGSITAGGVASNFGSHVFTSPGDVGWAIIGTVDLEAPAESIQVSLVNSLFASGLAWIQKTAPASVKVEIAPVPLPPTFLLLGGGLAALWGIRRRAMR